MRYIIHFISGNTLTITEEQYKQVLRHEVQELYVNMENVEYMIPEQEAPSGITHTPTPQELKKAKDKERDQIKGDTTAILKRTQEKYDESKDD